MVQKPVRPGGGGEHAVEPTERRRRPVEQVVEDEDQHQAEKERGRGLPDRRNGAAKPVNPTVRPQRRPHPQGYSHRQGQQQGAQRQFKRRRQTLGEIGEHRLTGNEGLSEIAVREAADIEDELLEEVVIEAEAMARFLDRRRRRRRPGEIGGGVSGEDVRQQEDDRDDADQVGRRRQGAAPYHSKRSQRAPLRRCAP